MTCCVRLHKQCWHLLALVAYSLKPVKLLGPCKRTQHCWANNTQKCWEFLALVVLRPIANGRNKPQHCWVQQCWELLALVAWCMQTNATTANIVAVRSLFWGLNNSRFCPKLFLYLFIGPLTIFPQIMVFIWHVPEARVFPREGQSAVQSRGPWPSFGAFTRVFRFFA